MTDSRAVIERLVSDARHYAERMSDDELAAYARIVNDSSDGIEAVWQVFIGYLATFGKSQLHERMGAALRRKVAKADD
jgi:predicted GNAT family N-acyltransferase